MNTARDFTLRLQDLLRRERLAFAEFLVALAAFDHRRLWVDLGYTSLFYFLHRELGLSKGAAHYRKTAAELIQGFPEIVEPLRDGRLCITTVVELAKVLTPENREEVLPRFFQLSKAEAKEVAAELRPDEAPPRRDVVTAVRAPAAPGLSLSLAAAPDPGQSAVHPANQPKEARVAAEPARMTAPVAPRPVLDSVEPLTAEASRVHVTVSRRFLRKLEAAHIIPRAAGGPSTVENCRIACEPHNDRAARRFFGNGCMDRFTRNPRASPPGGDGRTGRGRAPDDLLVTPPA